MSTAATEKEERGGKGRKDKEGAHLQEAKKKRFASTKAPSAAETEPRDRTRASIVQNAGKRKDRRVESGVHGGLKRKDG